MRTPDDLDLSEHDRFNHAWRSVEKVIIGLMALVCCSALAGLLGSGPISLKRVEPGAGSGSSRVSPDRTAPAITPMSYERIVRNHGSSWWHVRLAPTADGLAVVHIDAGLLRYLSVAGMNPRAFREDGDADGVNYAFHVARGAHSMLDLKFDSIKIGLAAGSVRIGPTRAFIHVLTLP